MLEIIDKIKDLYKDTDNMPIYSDFDFFIEKNMDYVEKNIFPLLERTPYDIIKLSKFVLRMSIKEAEGKIKEHEKYLQCPNIDKNNWSNWDEMQNNILAAYQDKDKNFSIEQDFEVFVNLRINLLDHRISSLSDKTIIEDIEKYKVFFLNHKQRIYSLTRIWECYYVYKIDEGLQTDKSSVIDLYKKYDIDINMDIQFKKYGLIKTKNFSNNPPQIYDERIDAVFLLKNSSIELIKLLTKIKKYIKDIAFQIDPDSILPNKQQILLSLESLEIGQYFSLQKFKNISINKLCDDSYQNFLWITVDNSNITFEEILDDFIENGDSVASQVIHIEYFFENNSLFIKHLDHEYILYTLEEYENRKTNSHQRGFNKIKTFKIDNSKIPIMVDDENILISIISIYFKRLDLLEEYFQTKIA